MRPGLWVTGLGLVTPLAVGVEPTWAALVRGDRAIGPVRLFDTTGQRSRLAAEVKEMTAAPGAPDRESRTSAMALAAAQEALGWAGLDVRRKRVGLVVGGTTGGMFETEELLASLHAEPRGTGSVTRMLSHPLTATGERLAESLGPFKRVRTLSSACSSGANALVVAASWLLAEDPGLDAVLAGGSDALCRLTLTGFNALNVLDPEPCRPFHTHRRGTTLGEGAGFLVLERVEDAIRRGGTPVAELAGWALGAEGHHITNPAPDGAVISALIRKALERAGRTPAEVDYVSAHGTGTPASDPAEARALKLALGGEIRRVPVSSSKAQIGHTLGAAGAIEAAITALVVHRRTLVPTAALDEADPELDLVHVPRVGREVTRVRVALSNAFGFGGMDTVLVLSEPARPTGSPRRGASVSVMVTGVAALGPWGLAAGEACARIVEGGEKPIAAFDLEGTLDPHRGRRLDKTARLAAVVAQAAMHGARSVPTRTGALFGNAFGNVDACAAFLHKVFKSGPRAASPAEFPNLVPSSPVGHVSIYLGLHGPTFATSDLASSGESAVVQAVQLLASGETESVVAGAAEPHSDIVGGVFHRLFHRGSAPLPPTQSDVAAAVVLESARDAETRDAPLLARVDQVIEWRDGGSTALRDLVSPRSEGSEVLLVGRAEALLAETEWHASTARRCDEVCSSDARGAVAVAIAASRIGCKMARQILVLSHVSGSGYAVVLSNP